MVPGTPRPARAQRAAAAAAAAPCVAFPSAARWVQWAPGAAPPQPRPAAAALAASPPVLPPQCAACSGFPAAGRVAGGPPRWVQPLHQAARGALCRAWTAAPAPAHGVDASVRVRPHQRSCWCATRWVGQQRWVGRHSPAHLGGHGGAPLWCVGRTYVYKPSESQQSTRKSTNSWGRRRVSDHREGRGIELAAAVRSVTHRQRHRPREGLHRQQQVLYVRIAASTRGWSPGQRTEQCRVHLLWVEHGPEHRRVWPRPPCVLARARLDVSQPLRASALPHRGAVGLAALSCRPVSRRRRLRAGTPSLAVRRSLPGRCHSCR